MKCYWFITLCSVYPHRINLSVYHPLFSFSTPYQFISLSPSVQFLHTVSIYQFITLCSVSPHRINLSVYHTLFSFSTPYQFITLCSVSPHRINLSVYHALFSFSTPYQFISLSRSVQFLHTVSIRQADLHDCIQ